MRMASPKSTSDSLHQKLEESGLDIKYWSKVLKSDLEITKLQQVCHLDASEIDILSKSKRHNWEIGALKQLVHSIKPGENITNKHQRAELLVNQLKDLNDTIGVRSDNLIKNQVDRLCLELEVPPAEWLKQYDSETISDVVTSMTVDLAKLEPRLVNVTVEASSDQVLNNASDGLALRGVLLTDDLKERMETRAKVLSAPPSIELHPPKLTERTLQRELSSKRQCEEYKDMLQTLGYNIASKQGTDTKNVVPENHGRDNLYYSRTCSVVVPTALIDLNGTSSLRLSPNALEELQIIDKLLTTGGGEGLVKSKCKDFLKKYGSHVNIGNIHFGGVYTYTVAYSGCGSLGPSQQSMVDMVSDILSAVVSASYTTLLPLLKADGSLNFEKLRQLGLLSNSYDSSLLLKTSVHITRTGGMETIASVPLWKASLQLGNDMCSVVDRGSSFSVDFCSIWDLLHYHQGDVDDAGKLADKLLCEWQNLGGEISPVPTTPTTSDENQLVAFDELKKVVEKIEDWVKDPELLHSVMDYLEQLQKAVHRTKSKTQWQNILSKVPVVSAFFYKIMNLELGSSIIHHTKMIIEDMAIDWAGAVDFDCKDDIRRWIAVTPQLNIDRLKDFTARNVEGLLSFIVETLLPCFEAGRANSETVTKDLAICISKVSNCLKSNEEFHQHSFLITMLHWLSYDKKLMCFEQNLTYNQIKSFSVVLQQQQKRYEEYAAAGQIQLEAYLLWLVLDTDKTCHSTVMPMEVENKLHQAIEDFKAVMTKDVKNVTDQYVDTKNWEGFEKTLTTFMCHGKKALETEPLVLPISPSREDGPVQETTPVQTKELRLEQADAPCEKLLTQLHLGHMYPRKITLRHIIAIKKDRNEKHKLDLADIPWVILQRILMIDYNGRNTAWERRLVDCSDAHDNTDSGDFLENLLAGIDNCSSSINIPNPMDIFIATFSCCDLMLRQVILEKMNMCRLAVPLVMPDLSEPDLTLCFWALRSVVVECFEVGHAVERSLVECQMKIASFVRLGESSLSKSQLLNDILNEQSHHTFFSKQCSSLGNSDRYVSNGLIEAAWYLPSDRDCNVFDDVTMFLNLRGDAFNYSRQTRLVGFISSVITIIVDIKTLADDCTVDAIRSFQQNQAGIIIVLIGSANTDAVKSLIATFREKFGTENLLALKVVNAMKSGRDKTLIEIRHEVRDNICLFLKERPKTTFEHLRLKALEEQICVDENDEVCQQGKGFADKVVNHIKDMSIARVKNEMLPIQKDHWPEWSRLLKAKNRTTGKERKTTSVQESDRFIQQMASVREEQLKKCKTLSPMMQAFSSTLGELIDTPNKMMFFLQWLKLYFDKRSRENLPSLRQEYNKLWAQSKVAKSKPPEDPTSLKDLEEGVQSAELRLAEASCGLEHLLREVGQLYEASKESNVPLAQNTQRVIDQLPMIAAKLILLGHPIELMDGDAANVPQTWVQAILKCLASLTGDKRVFVLSVLGIQSSGKSTLMNTMFGLRFAVSAGRCTRGMYVQLVEVDRSETGLPFDYIMVVDTEGLRAPELCHDKHEHDNELATLVIGLGDVVILNIKGENVAEMKDVLQIAVHAFLRMKIVQLRQTCVFIHQNVSAANANEKMMHGRQALLDKLDEMTEQAAEQEEMKDIHTFSQIIDLDLEKCVWYFSDLWRGDPPMAPINPGYSERVQSVKKCLLYKIANAQQQKCLSMTNLTTRIQDLWQGILADDFVFSFRNSLAVKAYSGLEDKYHEVAWVIERSIMKWSSETAPIKLERCETEGALETTAGDLLNELKSKVADILKVGTTELEQYFEQNSLQDIIIQWKEEKMHSYRCLADALDTRTRKDIIQKKEVLKFELRNTTKQEDLDQRIVSKASELAEKLRGQRLPENELQSKFDSMWVGWVTELAPPPERHDTPVAVEVEHVLYKWLDRYRVDVRKELKLHPLSSPFKGSSLFGTFRMESGDIRQVKCLADKVRYALFDAGRGDEAFRKQVIDFTEKIFEKMELYFKDLLSMDSKFQPFYAAEVVKTVTEHVECHNKHDSQSRRFTFLPKYTVRLTVHVCRRAVQVFSELRETYESKHSPAGKLEIMRNAAFNVFKNKVFNSTNERVAADLFCDRLAELIKRRVSEKMPMMVFEEVCNDFSQKKYHLIIAVLEDLADRDIFDEWAEFLADSKTYTFKWMTAAINKKCLSSNLEQGGSYYSFASSCLSTVLSGVLKCVRMASEHVHQYSLQNPYSAATIINEWMRIFCDQAETHLAVREGQIKYIAEQGVTDFENFEKLATERLRQVKEEMLCSYREMNTIVWEGSTPSQMVMDKLWGCSAHCPFCKAPCQWTDSSHCEGANKVSHRCIQHRPEGLGGYRWTNGDRAGRLTVESCNYLVQMTGASFSCRNEPNTCTGNVENHPYTKYKTYYPLWDISPSATMESSKFWMWFMASHQEQLKDHHEAKSPDIPKSWYQITKEQALKSLRESL
ncbi:interferon-induced very large GTPase 1-like [Lineus longissimus]|uniref:interferon-induced very large GTPase 1-like n=1 Tax=Lineus longissimus TaxID=88925 RepID=UPI00315CD0C7